MTPQAPSASSSPLTSWNTSSSSSDDPRGRGAAAADVREKWGKWKRERFSDCESRFSDCESRFSDCESRFSGEFDECESRFASMDPSETCVERFGTRPERLNLSSRAPRRRSSTWRSSGSRTAQDGFRSGWPRFSFSLCSMANMRARCLRGAGGG